MSEPVAQAPKFRVFSVLGQSFSVLFRNIVPFGIISLVFSSPGYIFYQFTDPFDFLIKPQVPFIIASIPSVFVMAVFASGVCRILARPDLIIFDLQFMACGLAFPRLGLWSSWPSFGRIWESEYWRSFPSSITRFLATYLWKFTL